MSVESIITDVEMKIDKVHTQSLDLSFNELLDMFDNKELDITPDYQRLFRWTEGARSRFIESLILEMPVPPIYVVETDDGVYQLIDGLQRFSSYLHFRGHLDAPHMEIKRGDKLILSDCDIVDQLNGLTFDALPTALKIKLKRSFVHVEVVRKGSDSKFKYHMFKRLNTGGTLLTEHQIRNCTVRMLNSVFIDFISNLAGNENFKVCTSFLTEAQKNGGYADELVLRYFTFKNNFDEFKHDIGDYLTDYMEAVTEGRKPFDYQTNEENFIKTFTVLSKAHGDKVFGRLGKDDNLQSNFSVYHFESIIIGIQKILDKINPENKIHISKISESIINLKKDADFKSETTGGGKNSPGPLRKRVALAERYFLEGEYE